MPFFFLISMANKQQFLETLLFLEDIGLVDYFVHHGLKAERRNGIK